MKTLKVGWEIEESNDKVLILDSIFDILLPDSELCGEDDLENERTCGKGNPDNSSNA